MPNSNASSWLELPSLPGLSADTLAALNDRFRTIASGLGGSGTPAAPASVFVGGGSGQQLILSVPGTLGVLTNAAPVVSLSQGRTPTGLVGILKNAPQGAPVQFTLLVAGVAYTTMTLPTGLLAPVMLAGALGGGIAANAAITLNITQVGTVFPGSDLSVLMRF